MILFLVPGMPKAPQTFTRLGLSAAYPLRMWKEKYMIVSISGLIVSLHSITYLNLSIFLQKINNVKIFFHSIENFKCNFNYIGSLFGLLSDK